MVFYHNFWVKLKYCNINLVQAHTGLSTGLNTVVYTLYCTLYPVQVTLYSPLVSDCLVLCAGNSTGVQVTEHVYRKQYKCSGNSKSVQETVQVYR